VRTLLLPFAFVVSLFAACSSDPPGSGNGSPPDGKEGGSDDGSVDRDAHVAREDASSEADGAAGEDAVNGSDAIDAATNDASSAGGDGARDAIAEANDASRDAPDASSSTEPVHYYGRWNRLTGRAITVNSGSHVVAQFDGTGIVARLDVSGNGVPVPTVTWRVDQGAWQEAQVAASMTLATNLQAGPHEVWLMARGLDENQSRWTAPLASSLTFLGFDVSGGALRASTRPARPKIEFLGDSITEGVAVFADRTNMTGASWRADGRIAYPCQTAMTLGAEWRQVGFGRQGVTIVGHGGVPKAAETFDWIYAGVPRDTWQPDVVVINQGTNDQGASSDVFRPAYAAYLGVVRKGYPLAWIAALRPFGGYHAADIQMEVAARVAQGDTRIGYVDTTGWLAGPDFTDGVHPNPQGSAKAAQLLVPVLRPHLP
jgi:lysophospholipase L1-like esterase